MAGGTLVPCFFLFETVDVRYRLPLARKLRVSEATFDSPGAARFRVVHQLRLFTEGLMRSTISGALIFAAGLMPLSAWAAINGTITGATATQTGCWDASCPETAKSVTTNISFITSSAIMTNAMGAAAFNSYNFVYAQNYPGGALANIPDSDFTISQYAPWVIDNNATTNFVSGPDQTSGVNNKHHRSLTGEDAGGANIVISYNPRAASNDPTDINFLQAYQLNTNGAGFNAGTMDNGGGANPPSYNGSGGVSGTGTTNRSGTSPLTTTNAVA